MHTGFVTPVLLAGSGSGTTASARALATAAAPLAVLRDGHRHARPLIVGAGVQPTAARPTSGQPMPADGRHLRLPRCRGSAAALALAALDVAGRDPDGVLVVLRAGCQVAGELRGALDAAIGAARRGWLVRVGVRARPADGGYGRLGLGAVDATSDAPHPQDPGAEAQAHDTGLLVAGARALLEMLEHDAPGLLAACRALLEGAVEGDDGLTLPADGLIDVPVTRIEDLLDRTPARVGVVLADADRPVAATPSPVPGSAEEVFRPWGSYRSVLGGDGFQVKQLTVNPDSVLSLQSHRHRAEHWTVVQGEAEVTCDGRVFTLRPDQSTYIPLGAVHRLANRGTSPLRVVEVQCGDYLGEDDIVRYEDVYGRVGA